MPITLTPSFPGTLFGPGVGFTVSSDLVGPIQPGTEWIVTAFAQSDMLPDSEIGVQNKLAQQPLIDSSTWFTPKNGWLPATGGAVIAEGATATVTAALNFQGSQVDTPTAIPLTWTTGNLGQQALELQSGVAGGFTDADRQQLQDVATSTVLSHALDLVTLTELTNGPQGGFVGANILDFAFGVIVRLATIDIPRGPQTPDGDYWFPTLAVVRIFRGSDLWLRVPVHTSNKLIPFAEEGIVPFVTAATVTQWLLNMSIQVTFLEGVTGQVFLMRFP